MAEIPVTSQTLLRDIAGDSQSVRWSEFVGRYRPMMEAYVHEYFPYLETDDLVQETLIALVEKLPTYKYNPKETGHFRNYLTGILKRKALRVCSQDKRRGEVMADYRLEPRKDSDNPREVSEAEEEKAPRIVRNKKFEIRPMSEEEAMLQMEMLGHSFFVFENAATGEINVLYARKDGNYGLIEPA